MVDILQYRAHIGLFRQKTKNFKFLQVTKFYKAASWNENKSGKLVFNAMKSLLKIFFLSIFLTQVSDVYPSLLLRYRAGYDSETTISTWCRYSVLTQSWCRYAVTTYSGLKYRGVCTFATYRTDNCGMYTGNFWARYMHGNEKTKVKGFKNMHFNIRSLKYKVGEIKNILKQESPQILGLSECEIRNESNIEKNLKVPGYDIIFPKSWELHGFARVVVYVQKTLQYEHVTDLEGDVVQSVWIRAAFRNCRKMYFCHAYREHSSMLGDSLNSQKDYLDRFLLQWEAAIEHNSPSEPNEVHVSCDMNLDHTPGQWLNPRCRLCSMTSQVQNVCNSLNFSQLVSQPTRVMHNSVSNTTEVSCIDHVYCNYKHKCSTPRLIINGSSDHDIVLYTRFSKKPPNPSRTIRRRSYKNFVEENFIADVSRIDWSDVLSNADVDEAAELFTSKFRQVLDKHAPWIIYQHRKFFNPWLTEETKEQMKLRDYWKAKAKSAAIANQSGEATDEEVFAWNEYKKLRNAINNRKHIEENEYKKKKITENIESPGKVWKVTKQFMNWKSVGSPTQLELGGTLITSAKSIAQEMNKFFINKVKQIKTNMARAAINMGQCLKIMESKQCKLYMQHITVGKVCKLLKGLSSSRSTAVDELDNYSVKIAAPLIAQPLHHVITLSIMSNKFPSSWKYAKILPLHKKLCPLQMKNYRPVAILSPLSKILEKAIYEQIYNYFTNNKIFHPSLHGYRKNRSTQSALLQLYDRWVQAAHHGQVSGAVLLDLSAAFDLVPPDLLVEKLRIYGLQKDFLTWTESYLTNRYQAVWIDHTTSEFLPLDVGVPQGSNLGPLFFLIFVNDLSFLLTCDVEQYADDTTLTVTGKTTEAIEKVLEGNCEVVSNWMIENQFKLNADKTHIMTLGTQQRLSLPGNKVSIAMDGLVLKDSADKSETLLGIEVDSNLKWHSQIAKLVTKLRSRLAGLGHVKFVLPFKLRKTVSEGLFNSVLGYCLPLHGGCDVGEIKQLQVLQNRAAQLVTLSPSRAPRAPMYDMLDWITVNQLVRYHTILTVYRIRMSREPEYLAASLCNDNRLGKIIIQNTRLSLVKNSFKIRGATNWNELPAEIRSEAKIGLFKKKLRSWIKANVPKFLD